MSARMPSHLELAVDAPKSWKIWLHQFQWYSTCVELEQKSEDVKISVFMTAIEPDVVEIFNTFPKDKRKTL
ncbi:hypothetical protein JTE90_008724 [Oedothorax gibbosus]|uniref:Uncharacterized protein n=1 Tax=Oedothorax gibbosus TaxID=931172 RepID=A0AAV6UPS7_9ARAC|nr:hypothetical protein JTE90_008724 [Oedothorax gibbosus]